MAPAGIGAELPIEAEPPIDAEPPFEAVRRAVSSALAEDLLPQGDITSMLLPPRSSVAAAFVARHDGVVAGLACAGETFAAIDAELDLAWSCRDGYRVTAGGELGRVSGSLCSIVTGERVALNFLCHLSGIASLTHRYVQAARAANPSCSVVDTRKTTPGLRSLEKAAVRAGGGRNHRASLSEGVLLKDNHLAAISIAEAVSRARSTWPGRMVEVECDRYDQLVEALEAGATMVLLDNMTPQEVKRCVERAAQHESTTGSRPLVEVSGGVSLDTVASFAAAGPDLISVGALTHSAPILDIGLDLVS